MPPVYSGFDPGSQRMGFTVGDGAALPTVGAWRFAQTGDDLGAMLVQLDGALNDHFDRYQPAAVCYESPILLRRDTLGRLRKTLNLGGHIEYVCARRGIPCSEVGLRDVKCALAGFPKAEKADQVAAALKLGVTLPATVADGREDAADSLGAWLLLLRAHNRGYAQKFDAALYGSRANALL